MTSLSIIQYIGSKRTDIKFYESKMPNPENIDISVELFGGSGYNSLYLFSKNNKIKSIINDNDETVINFFNEIKKNPDAVINGCNNLIEPRPSKEQYTKLKEEYIKKESDNLRRAILYLFFSKFHGVRQGLYPSDNRKVNTIKKDDYNTFFEWLKNTEFTNKDYSEIYTQIKEDKSKKRYFIFLDPPYFDSFNSYYSSYQDKMPVDKVIRDKTGIYIDILKYLKEIKKNTMLIINKNCITEFIYKDYIKGEYDKTYCITKKKTKHLIIHNYK
jgi:site-specific DNA-adenine methylase